jgi:hypothetical protein
MSLDELPAIVTFVDVALDVGQLLLHEAGGVAYALV